MSTRRHRLKPDARGQYRPRIGWYECSKTGERKQKRFNLGSETKSAELKYAAIQQLYEENLQTNKDQHWSKEEVWSPLALSYAVQLAKGKNSISFKMPSDIYEDPLSEYAQMMEVNQRFYPSLSFVPADPHSYSQSVTNNKEIIYKRMQALESDLKELGVLAGQRELPDKIITGTFYESLDAYKQMIQRDGAKLDDGSLKQSQRKKLERAERFKSNHNDFPLWELNFDKCKELISYWRNRPVTKRGKRSSYDNARHHVAEIVAYLKWLDSDTSSEWSMPKGVLSLSRKVERLTEDRKKAVVSKNIYSVDELATIASYCNEWERLHLLLGLNLAGGAAEIGRLSIDDILFDHQYEFAERLHFTPSANDNFVRTYRPKTDVFSEHILWPETTDILKWGIARSKKLDSSIILVDDDGEPCYKESAANPQYQFANMWKNLIKKVQDDLKEFPFLPFGTLRDTLPDTLRHTHSDELATLALGHGTPEKGDDLLDCYGNRPYGRLHEAIRELREHFITVLKISEK